MTGARYQSWGRYPRCTQQVTNMSWRQQELPEPVGETATLLPYGNGRSYGDVCLNRGGTLIATRGLDRFIRFDPATGVLRCEAGVLLADILALAVPRGWFLPVSPGTRYVTVGGALANDVHGKNHHRAGTFGRHVRSFELLRSDGSRRLCAAGNGDGLFAATIGGLGLTGLITWVELQLRPVAGPMLEEESIKFAHVDEFFELSDYSDQHYEYTVAWIDCVATGDMLGRGLFARANHAEAPAVRDAAADPGPRWSLPIAPPVSLVNKLSLRLFNALWYAKQRQKHRERLIHYRPFFYPLDAIANWNLMYGPKGMLQYQCVLPGDDGRALLPPMLNTIAESGHGSFLAVLKMFGDEPSPGLLSFPRPGVTLALDFPNRPEVFRLLDRLDDMTREAGGAVYPAKDARMSGESFRAFFPRWQELARHVDPGFSSSFWRRVTEEL
jgi:FAD/FMN-containing dehydrogenase